MSAFFTVTKKELQDHFNSWRFLVLLGVMIAAIVYVYYAIGVIRSDAAYNTPDFIFLSLFTTQAISINSSFIPSNFMSLMSTLLPIAAIILGLDAINSERNGGTLGRLVSQPIYRDSIINAKFLAGVITLSIVILATVLLGSAMGMKVMGVAPGSEEIMRLIVFVIVAIVYSAFWLGLAILFSTLFKQVAVSSIISVAIWLFFVFFYPIIFQMIANAMTAATEAEAIHNANSLILLSRLSPIQLFNENMAVILVPVTRSSSQLLQLLTTDAGNYFIANPLTLMQSIISIWPQLVITVLLTTVCFAISYVKFMFEEIRAI
jgi:ABC-2 type transport system permease protein